MNWEPVSDDFGDRSLLHLAIDPGGPNRLFATARNGELLASGDGGQSWGMLAQP